ncbi:retrotransposon ORF1 [Tanacetum coccineum]
METDEVSEWYIAPCFVNGLDAYDGEINLALDGNLISNEYAVKLCLDYEVKKRNKEDDVEPEVIFGRSFMRLVNGIIDFSSGVITVYPKQDPFEDDYEKTEKRKSSRNKKRAIENLNLFYLDIRPSLSTGRHLTQEEESCQLLSLIMLGTCWDAFIIAPTVRDH